MNSYSSPSLSMIQNRRFQDQQQPIITDQQFSQPFIQQPQTSVFQGTPQRSMLRAFQSLPSWMANNLNTQSTSSSIVDR